MSDITESRADRTSAKLPQEPTRTPAIMGSRAYRYALWASDENNKKRSAGKVDMVVSLINAVFLLQLDLLSRDGEFFVQY